MGNGNSLYKSTVIYAKLYKQFGLLFTVYGEIISRFLILLAYTHILCNFMQIRNLQNVLQ